MAIENDEKRLVDITDLQDIADAIRDVTGTEDMYAPEDMAKAIRSVGGASIKPGNNITISDTNAISVTDNFVYSDDLYETHNGTNNIVVGNGNNVNSNKSIIVGNSNVSGGSDKAIFGTGLTSELSDSPQIVIGQYNEDLNEDYIEIVGAGTAEEHILDYYPEIKEIDEETGPVVISEAYYIDEADDKVYDPSDNNTIVSEDGETILERVTLFKSTYYGYIDDLRIELEYNEGNIFIDPPVAPYYKDIETEKVFYYNEETSQWESEDGTILTNPKPMQIYKAYKISPSNARVTDKNGNTTFGGKVSYKSIFDAFDDNDLIPFKVVKQLFQFNETAGELNIILPWLEEE